MASAAASHVFSKRFTVSLAGFSMYSFSSYPLFDPCGQFTLNLAGAADAVELFPEDPFVKNLKQIATRMGVRNPERLSIRISDETSGASIGSNLTLRLSGGCIVLPRELHQGFHATAAQRTEFDLPEKEEVNFVLAHEIAHIARNHSILTTAFLPGSIMTSYMMMKCFPNKLIGSLLGCFAIAASNIWMSWQVEHEADHMAASLGFAKGGINCFQRKLSRNCELRTLLNTSMITKKGNYLGDTSHPLLTTRLQHLEDLLKHTQGNDSCIHRK
jgi:hypothetical protein